jgi:hypothetical protein
MVSEVDKLRAELRRVRANTSAKISRVKKSTGANIAGSSYDPRPAVGHEKRLNSKQLRSAIAKMQEFNRPSVKFVALHNGAPLSKMEWARYQSKVNLRNIKAEKFTKDLANATFPGMEETPAAHQAKLYEKADGGTIGPFDIVGNRPQDLTGLAAIKKMEAKINRELKPNFREKKMAIARQQLKNAMINMGQDTADIQAIEELNDWQFNLIWFGSPIPEAAFQQYGAHMAIEGGSAKDWQVNIVERNELSDLIDTVREPGFPKGPETSPAKGQTSQSRSRQKRPSKR